MAEDTQIKKYINHAITELDKVHEKRSKERGQEADRRIVKHLEAVEKRSDVRIIKHLEVMEKRVDERIEASLKRHIGALTEDFNDKLSGVAEMVGGLMVDVTEIKLEHKLDMIEVKSRLDVIQSDVEIIKNDLKQKVDRSEFEALVKRVSFVEKKFATK